MATSSGITNFRFTETNITMNTGETHNLIVEGYSPDWDSWDTLPYGDASKINSVVVSDSNVVTAVKTIDSSNNFYILITGLKSGFCTVTATCQPDGVSQGTHLIDITCEVTVTPASNSTGKYLLDSQGNRFSPIVSAETVYLEDGTSVKETLSGLEELLSEV